MIKLPAVLSLVVVATLAACGGGDDVPADLSSAVEPTEQVDTAEVPETEPTRFTSAEEIRIAMVDAGLECEPVNLPEAPGDPDALETIVCDQFVIKKYLSPEVAENDMYFDQRDVWESIQDLEELTGSDTELDQRLWVLSEEFSVLCSPVSVCGEIHALVGGTIERYPTG